MNHGVAGEPMVAGVDVGCDCVKAVVLGPEGSVRGQSVTATRGYFRDCAHHALSAACLEAGIEPTTLAAVCGTGFAPDSVPGVTMTFLDSTCHAVGVLHSVEQLPMTLIDLGGHKIHVIALGLGDDNKKGLVRSGRRCALGVGTFLWQTARQLDVHPARLQELAAAATPSAQPASAVSSYCSVFATTEVLERLRDGHSREAVAAACIESIVERICEVGGIVGPAAIVGGVIEYIPGIVKRLAERLRVEIHVPPSPQFTAALGAACLARSAVATTTTTGEMTP